MGALTLLTLALPPTASAEEIVWTESFGAAATDTVGGLAADGAGPVVTGTTSGALDGANAGGTDVFVRRYDASGAVAWTRQMGTAANEVAAGVAVDDSGVTVTGTTSGELPGPNLGGTDAFVSRYDLSGAVLWTRQVGSTGNDSASAIAADDAGVTIVGYAAGALHPAPADLAAAGSFLMRFDRAGNVLWPVREPGYDPAQYPAQSIAADAEGITVVGTMHEARVRRYDRAGTLLWTRTYGGDFFQSPSRVAADEDGITVSYVSGFFDMGTEYFSWAYLRRLTRSGDTLWERVVAPSASIRSLAADAVGPVAAGSGVLYRYDRSGNLRWSHSQSAISVAAARGAIYVAGGAGEAMFVRRYGEESPTGVVQINGGRAYTNTTAVRLDVPATDPDGVESVRVSNSAAQSGGMLTNGITLPYAAQIDWDLADPDAGGSPAEGQRSVYVQWADPAGHWSVVKTDSVVIETVRPVVVAPAERMVQGGHISSGRIPLSLTWSGSDNWSGIARYRLQRSTDGGAWQTIVLPLDGARQRQFVTLIRDGHRYRYRVRAQDKAGNWSTWAAAAAFTVRARQETSDAIRYSGTWRYQSAEWAYGGALRRSAAPGSTASMTFTGRDVALVSTRGPNRGRVRVRIDGVPQTSANLYSESTQAQAVVFSRSFAEVGTHTIEFLVAATPDERSSGKRVDLDAIVVLR